MPEIKLDKAKTTRLARNLTHHLHDRHDLRLSHAQALAAVAALLGYNTSQAMSADLKGRSAADDRPREIAFINITHDYDVTSAVTAAADATAWLAAWCLEYWEQENLHTNPDGALDPTRLSDDDVIEIYFANCNDDYAIERIDLTALDPIYAPLSEKSRDQLDPTHPASMRRGWAVRESRIVRVGVRRFDSDAEAEAFVRRAAARHEPKALAALNMIQA